MGSKLTKIGFHLALYASYLGWRRPFEEISKESVDPTAALPKKLRIFFWTPALSPGAHVIVHEMLPSLKEAVRDLGLDWEIEANATVPDRELDWLVCFKAVPKTGQVRGSPRKVLLICDQAEVYWGEVDQFDEVVATSSRAFASLLAWQHKRVSFIPESETPLYLERGRENLARDPVARGNVLLWHGGKYSLPALVDLRPTLERWAQGKSVNLHVIGGQDAPSKDQWGPLAVEFFPWSKQQLFASAAQARLAIVPALRSLKLSWLKPASRVRCLYALGVPAIGDDRVPDVVEFMRMFGGPTVSSSQQWLEQLSGLWDDAGALKQIAGQGHAAVAREFTTRQTAWQWIRYLSMPTAVSKI